MCCMGLHLDGKRLGQSGSIDLADDPGSTGTYPLNGISISMAVP